MTDHKESSLGFLLKERPSSKNSRISPEQLEAFRRSVPLKIDERGRWWHNHEPFTHQRLIQLFNRGLDWYVPLKDQRCESENQHSPLPSLVQPPPGEAILRVGDRWCYVACDLTPFLIMRLSAQPDGILMAMLNTEESYPLGALTLRGEILFSRLSPTRFARFSAHAQGQCAPWLIEKEDSYILQYKGNDWPITSDLP
jgi:hypothetical protein